MFINQVRSYWSMILCLVLVFGLTIPMTGCSAVQDAIIVAEQVTHSASVILQPVEPAAAKLMLSAEADLKLISTLYTDYGLAAAAAKPGIASQLEAVLTTLTSHLQGIMSAVGVGALSAEITVAVGVANAIITLIVNHLPKANAVGITTVRNAHPLPTLKATSAADLKAAWNAAVAAKHPKARI